MYLPSSLFKLLCSFFICTLGLQANAQFALKGKITDVKTAAVLPAVSIYINNSSKGTTSNEAGAYILDNITITQFEIVATCIGYETFSTSITEKDLLQAFDIKLNPKSTELQAVIIQTYDKSGWKNWGKLFTNEILGRTPKSDECEIKNYNVVKFVYDKKEQKLSAFADEPLIIINKYIGYELRYDMQFFETNFKTKIIHFEGFPFFTNLAGSKRKIDKWKKNRKYAYDGSVQHFMRSVYKNNCKEEGFQIRVLKRYPNTEKIRVRKLYKDLFVKENGVMVIKKNDSLDYYQKILRQPENIDFVSAVPINVDSVSIDLGATTVALRFKDFLQITHSSLKEIPNTKSFEPKYIYQSPVSIISIINDTEIFVFSNGTYYNPSNLLTEDYWGYTERLSNMLPIDYEVGE